MQQKQTLSRSIRKTIKNAGSWAGFFVCILPLLPFCHYCLSETLPGVCILPASCILAILPVSCILAVVPVRANRIPHQYALRLSLEGVSVESETFWVPVSTLLRFVYLIINALALVSVETELRELYILRQSFLSEKKGSLFAERNVQCVKFTGHNKVPHSACEGG